MNHKGGWIPWPLPVINFYIKTIVRIASINYGMLFLAVEKKLKRQRNAGNESSQLKKSLWDYIVRFCHPISLSNHDQIKKWCIRDFSLSVSHLLIILLTGWYLKNAHNSLGRMVIIPGSKCFVFNSITAHPTHIHS